MVAFHSLSSWYLVIVVWLFLAVPWICLLFAIVVFPDHTDLLFLGSLSLVWVGGRTPFKMRPCFSDLFIYLTKHLLDSINT